MIPKPAATPILAAILCSTGALACSDSSASQGPGTWTEAAVNPTSSPPAPALSFDSLHTIALDAYYGGEFDSARSVLDDIARNADAAGDTAALARALTWLGLAAWRQGRYQDAGDLGERALTLKLEADLRDQLFRSYNALGLLAWNEARLGDAATMFERAAEAARAVGDHEGEAKAAGNLGLVATDLGEFAAAREGYTKMLEAARSFEDPILEGTALTNLGQLDITVGQARSSIPKLLSAVELFRDADYPTGQEYALGQLGTAYATLGDLGLAHAMYDSALSIAQRVGLKREEANGLEVLAELHIDADNRLRAIELYAAAAEIYREAGLEIELGRTLNQQALVYAQLGNLTLAMELATQALDTHRRVQARFEELLDLLTLVELSERNGDKGTADDLLREAQLVAAELRTRKARADVALAEARLATARLEPRRVLAALRRAGPDLFHGTHSTEWEAHALRTRAFLELGATDSALIAGRRAVSTVDRARGSLQSGTLRSGFASAHRQTYADYAAALLEAGRAAEAFQLADRARGQAFRNHVDLDLESDQGSALSARDKDVRPKELLRRIDQLVLTLDALEGEATFEEGDHDAIVEDLQSRLSSARLEYEALQIGVAERSLAPHAPPVPTPVADEIQAVLAEDEMLIEYLVTPRRTIAFVLTRDTLAVVESSLDEQDLESRVRLTRRLIADPSATDEEIDPILRALFESLIAPAMRVAPSLGSHKLLIVPHGVLTYLPFAALREPRSGAYLAERTSLAYLPSAASLVELRSGHAPPQLGRAGEPTHVLVPFPDELPASEKEGQAVRARRGAAVFHSEANATERALRLSLEDGGIVHVASHGVMNARNPMFSRLELYRGSPSDPDDDGRLEVHEVLELSVNATLVYLSGCETALGAATATTFNRGEDYATLAQSFLSAGARNVLATLWRVEDEGASVFADRFYHELSAGDPAEALARVQRRMISDSRFNAIRYWAGYRLDGAGP